MQKRRERMQKRRERMQKRRERVQKRRERVQKRRERCRNAESGAELRIFINAAACGTTMRKCRSACLSIPHACRFLQFFHN